MDELNHRVKNTLATIQALAYQTFRQSLPPEVARERFEARLISLSRTHNLLNEKNWTGAAFKDVLALELEPFSWRAPKALRDEWAGCRSAGVDGRRGRHDLP
jgi:two-component sensor histidine kinase